MACPATTGAGYGPAKPDLDVARTVHDLPIQALENGTMTIEHVKATSHHDANASKPQRDRATVKKRRYMRLVHHAEGMKLDGFLDPVAGQHHYNTGPPPEWAQPANTDPADKSARPPATDTRGKPPPAPLPLE